MTPAFASAHPQKAAAALRFHEAMRLMEEEIARLKVREADLLETSNRYLERARVAEVCLARLAGSL